MREIGECGCVTPVPRFMSHPPLCDRGILDRSLWHPENPRFGCDLQGAFTAREIDKAVARARCYLQYGHNDYQVHVFTGCRIRARAGVIGATLERIEVRSVAPRHSDRCSGRGTRRGRVPRRPRPIAGFPARAPGRCLPMGAGAEGRAPGGVSLAAFQIRMIHLDTSFLIRALGGVAVRPARAIRDGMGCRDRGTAPGLHTGARRAGRPFV